MSRGKVKILSTPTDLMLGERFKSGLTEMPSAKEIAEPWLEEVSSYAASYRVEGLVPDEVALSEEGDEHLYYYRGLIEAKLQPTYANNIHGEDYSLVVGMIFALDNQNFQKPIFKMYVGPERGACINLCVFRPVDVKEVGLNTPDFASMVHDTRSMIQRVEELYREFERAHEFLFEPLTEHQYLETVGQIGLKCARTSGMMSNNTQMLQMITSRKDYNGVRNYYYTEGEDQRTRYNLYQAFIAEKHSTGRLEAGVQRPDRLVKAFEFFAN